MIMASTEFAEVYEPFVKGRGASSTMPQKRNPISSELMLAAAKAVRQHAGLMLDAMIHDFERATGPWHAEWMAIPDSFVLTAGALHQAKFALGGLVVDEGRMAQNLGLSKGLILAEVVAEDPEVARHFDRAALDRLTDPANYLGLAPAMVDRVLAQSARVTVP